MQIKYLNIYIYICYYTSFSLAFQTSPDPQSDSLHSLIFYVSCESKGKVWLIGDHVRNLFCQVVLHFKVFGLQKIELIWGFWTLFSTKTWGKCPLVHGHSVHSVSGSWDFSLNTCLNNIRLIQHQTGTSSDMEQWIIPSWMHYEDKGDRVL